MLVKDAFYIVYFIILGASIYNLLSARTNKDKKIYKYIIISSIIFLIYSILNTTILPYTLGLDAGFEMLFFHALAVISDILLIVSIIISSTKINKPAKPNKIYEPTVYKEISIFLLLCPIILLATTYFGEIAAIKKSRIILVCSTGSGFHENDYAYALNDNYKSKFTIGSDFRGAYMLRYLPASFSDLKYTWTTDDVELNEDSVKIYRNKELLYEVKTTSKITSCQVERIIYRR